MPSAMALSRESALMGILIGQFKTKVHMIRI